VSEFDHGHGPLK